MVKKKVYGEEKGIRMRLLVYPSYALSCLHTAIPIPIIPGVFDSAIPTFLENVYMYQHTCYILIFGIKSGSHMVDQASLSQSRSGS